MENKKKRSGLYLKFRHVETGQIVELFISSWIIFGVPAAIILGAVVAFLI